LVTPGEPRIWVNKGEFLGRPPREGNPRFFSAGTRWVFRKKTRGKHGEREQGAGGWGRAPPRAQKGVWGPNFGKQIFGGRPFRGERPFGKKNLEKQKKRLGNPQTKIVEFFDLGEEFAAGGVRFPGQGQDFFFFFRGRDFILLSFFPFFPFFSSTPVFCCRCTGGVFFWFGVFFVPRWFWGCWEEGDLTPPPGGEIFCDPAKRPNAKSGEKFLTNLVGFFFSSFRVPFFLRGPGGGRGDQAEKKHCFQIFSGGGHPGWGRGGGPGGGQGALFYVPCFPRWGGTQPRGGGFSAPDDLS